MKKLLIGVVFVMAIVIVLECYLKFVKRDAIIEGQEVSVPGGDFCPKCNSNDVGKFVYGRLIMDSATVENIENHKWIPAGCTLSSKSPKYKCNRCSYEWGNHVDLIKQLKAKEKK